MSAAVAQSKPNGIPTPAELGFDPAAMRQKYAEERAKRLRADGNNQYQEITGEHEHYNVDPYVAPGFTRPAMHEELDVVIVGGGFGGLLAAARLQKAGITNIRILEKAGDFGGTWYWNQYPGAQCDIESYVYLPLSKRPAISRRKSTPSRRRSLNTPSGSGSISTSTSGPASRRRSKRRAGTMRKGAGRSTPIAAMSSRRAL